MRSLLLSDPEAVGEDAGDEVKRGSNMLPRVRCHSP